MKSGGPNTAASVHARLLAGAQRRQEDFNLTLQRYTAERFLYRLGESRHRETFVLKGAMLYPLWGASFYRPTRDLDLTGYVDDNPQRLVAIVEEICAVECPSDRLDFLVATIRAEPILDHAEYGGLRVRLQARLGTAKLRLQMDVGFGDVIDPPPQEEDYPTLIECPAPRIRAYPREPVVAEKLHAMVIYGVGNTRYKDFYDVVVLATNFAFAGARLVRAMDATFRQRGTLFAGERPIALTAAFYSSPERSAEWRRYLTKNALRDAPPDFVAIGILLQAFIGPAWTALAAGAPFDASWPKGGPWEAAS